MNQFNRMPRVLFVGAFPPKGRKIFGGNITACRVLLSSTFPERLTLDLIDSTQITNPAPSFFIRLLFAIKRLVLFVYLFECNKPDAVLLFTGSGIGLLEKGVMARYAKLRNVKAFLFPRGGGILKNYAETKRLPRWVKFSFSGAERIFCQGQAMKKFAEDTLGRKESDVVIVENWTATSDLLAIGEERSSKVPNDVPRLLFVGWLEKEKGLFELLAAVRNLKDSYKFVVDIVGDGTAMKNFCELVNEYGLSNMVLIHGWQSGVYLKNFYRKADVFILPSWAEGCPNALIEAMSSGLCVIATNVGNIPDVIKSGENGLLVPAQCTELLTSTIESVLIDSSFRCRLGSGAFQTSKNMFSVETAVEKLINGMFFHF